MVLSFSFCLELLNYMLNILTTLFWSYAFNEYLKINNNDYILYIFELEFYFVNLVVHCKLNVIILITN